MRFFLYSILLWCIPICALEVRLSEKLTQAIPGSYLVLEQNKTFTFFYIHELTDTTVTIEEVSISLGRATKISKKWKEWFENGAPGHTSWIISQVNLQSGMFEETFSFNHKGWVDMSDSNSFLTTLLNLRFQEVTHEERRRIGLPPGHNKIDRRPIWNPRLIVDGQIISDVAFTAYRTRWPSDGSELSRKYIEIYLPDCSKNSPDSLVYPVYFPYWLEVEGKIGSAKIRVVDSGINATSPKKNLPKQPPQLIGEPILSEKGLFFSLKSPSYYKEFLILAEEGEAFFGGTVSLPCEILPKEKNSISLFIPKEEIEKFLKRGRTYHIMISPKEEPTLIINTEATL